MLEAVLTDYQRCAVPSAREPEVLSVMGTVVNKLKNYIIPQIPKIFDAVFECTLDMINKDFEEYPEHTTRNVADTGLSILFQLLQNVSNHPEAAQSFYQTYYTDILQHMFSVVTDTSHTAGLTMHATILAYMFTLVESEKVTVPLNAADKTVTNMVHIQGFVANLLKSAFPHLSDNQIKITVTGLFNLNQDIPGFKDHLRDFLVQIREFTGEDDTDLYLEERETALKAAQDEKRKVQMSVPGILNPHEVGEEMQD